MRRFFLESYKAARHGLRRHGHAVLTIGIGTLLTAARPAVAQTGFIAIDALRAEVKQFAEAQLAPNYPHLSLGDSLRVTPGNLDSRLKLRACSSPLQMVLSAPATGASNMTVKTQCPAGNRWTIYVPLKVETYEDIAVAANTVGRGDVLDGTDIRMQRMNTSLLASGFVRDSARLVGQEARRQLRAGEVIKLNYVQAPDVVFKGDTVVLKARSRALTVATEGTALSNGQMGQQIKVRNNRSLRVVDGLVMGPGEVQVSGW